MKKSENCQVCASRDFVSVRKPSYFRGEAQEFNIDACSSCGFWFTNPAPQGAELARYYESDDYVSHTDGKGGLMDWVYNLVRTRAIKSKLQLVTGSNPPTRRLIDYGAGTGAFLSEAKKNNWDIGGFEPSELARENAEKKGVPLLSPENRESLKDGSVGVFSLWHVLEHIPDLNETFNYFNRKLSDKGLLIIAVPNHECHDAQYYGDDWAALDVPLHLWHFAKKDMAALAVKHGFTVENTRNMVFDSFYVSLLSEKNRTGKQNVLAGFWRGLRSNVKGRTKKNMSSLIYVLRKN
jgi:predicted SAM-dependent methyltransferase